MWLKVRVSSLRLFHLHGSCKLVKSDDEMNDNLSKSMKRYVSFFKFI